MKIILASASPRRKELLEMIGLPFTVVPSQVEEPPFTGGAPEEYALALAMAKGEEVAGQVPEGLVIAADTIVVVDEMVLGKPATTEEARRMLRLLSGRTHVVITGVVVREVQTGRTASRAAKTLVTFRPLSSEEIDRYVATGEPMDKAGAYGIQGRGALLVERIEGCYFNVVGLPLVMLGELLQLWGVTLL